MRYASVCGGHGRFRGRFTPPPNPSRVFLLSAGLTGLASPIPAPLLRPGASAPLFGGQARAPSPEPPCRVRKERPALVGSSLLNSRACAQPPADAGASLAAYCSPSGRSTPEAFGRFCAALAYAAQSRSQAGCARAGDPLATTVCGHRNVIGAFKRYRERPFATIHKQHPGAGSDPARPTSSTGRWCFCRRLAYAPASFHLSSFIIT